MTKQKLGANQKGKRTKNRCFSTSKVFSSTISSLTSMNAHNLSKVTQKLNFS